MSTPGSSSQLYQIMDVSNPSTSACNIFSSMGSSDSDDDFQKSEVVLWQCCCVYWNTQKQMPKNFYHVRGSYQQ